MTSFYLKNIIIKYKNIIFKIYIMIVYYHNYKLYKTILRTKYIYSSY